MRDNAGQSRVPCEVSGQVSWERGKSD
jgi:hypothetical protein